MGESSEVTAAPSTPPRPGRGGRCRSCGPGSSPRRWWAARREAAVDLERGGDGQIGDPARVLGRQGRLQAVEGLAVGLGRNLRLLSLGRVDDGVVGTDLRELDHGDAVDAVARGQHHVDGLGEQLR